jgi:hypothetical protein
MLIEGIENKPEEKEPEQYWVRFGDVTKEDLEAIIEIVSPMVKGEDREEYPFPSFDDFSLVGELGYGEWQLKKKSYILEARRRLGFGETPYVRFKVSHETRREAYFNSKESKELQKEIDNIFIKKGTAIPLSQTF